MDHALRIIRYFKYFSNLSENSKIPIHFQNKTAPHQRRHLNQARLQAVLQSWLARRWPVYRPEDACSPERKRRICRWPRRFRFRRHSLRSLRACRRAPADSEVRPRLRCSTSERAIPKARCLFSNGKRSRRWGGTENSCRRCSHPFHWTMPCAWAWPHRQISWK